MAEETNIISLPQEIMTKICFYLYRAELTNLMLVSRGWKKIAGDPLLWSRYFLTFNRKTFVNFDQIIRMERFSSIKSLKISDGMMNADYELYPHSSKDKTFDNGFL